MRKHKKWSKLDNAAMIFPPTTTSRDTKVFRMVCELCEPCDEDILNSALNLTLSEFPLYRTVLKKGLFWYYMEECDVLPKVWRETLPVCSPLYNADKPGLLFRVVYFGCRINFEVYHALADGTGGMQFFRSMIYHYLAEKHGISGNLTDYDASLCQKNEDAFYKYHDKDGSSPKPKRYRAYRIKGELLPFNRLGITEGFMSVKTVLEKSKQFGATLGEFLTAILIESVYESMAVRERSRPVAITVPVDLRRFFPAQTARNFFGVIQVVHNFEKDGKEFERILENVKKSFAEQITQENLSGIIRRYSALENNLFIKLVPLVLKIPLLRMSGLWVDREDTAAFSNVGRVAMPAEAANHINLFDVFLSTKRPQICTLSFGDTLAVSMSSPFADTGIQRRFFRRLTCMGIALQVVSNLEQINYEET